MTPPVTERIRQTLHQLKRDMDRALILRDIRATIEACQNGRLLFDVEPTQDLLEIPKDARMVFTKPQTLKDRKTNLLYRETNTLYLEVKDLRLIGYKHRVNLTNPSASPIRIIGLPKFRQPEIEESVDFD